jgi:hypothetical protein
VAQDGTPLLAVYRNWRKLADTQSLKRHAKQEEGGKDYAHIPLLKKNNKKIRMKAGMEQEVLGDLLDTDGEDSLGRVTLFLSWLCGMVYRSRYCFFFFNVLRVSCDTDLNPTFLSPYGSD